MSYSLLITHYLSVIAIGGVTVIGLAAKAIVKEMGSEDK